MPRQKPHLNIVFVGHVDNGKSTTIGRLLVDLGLIDQKTLEELKKLAQELGKETFEFAFIMDRLKEERQRGLTIDISHYKIETKKYEITIIDAPGHRDFIKNMITGAKQADAAVLVVSAKPGEAETALGPEGQGREHIILTKVLGINQYIIVINKMDTVNYDQKRFEEVKNMVLKIFKLLGIPEKAIKAIIPASAYYGDNIVKKSDKMPWYNGPTLYEAFDLLEEPPRPIDKPFRMPIQDVYSIKGVGTVPVGKVETGRVRVGDKVIILPSKKPNGVVGEVRSIEMHHQPLEEAVAGDNIGINIRGVEKRDISRGDVIGKIGEPLPTVAEEFKAQIIVLWHPSVIAPGYTPVFHVHTAAVACKIVSIDAKLDPKTGKVAEQNPQFIKPGDAAIITVQPTRPLVIEEVSFIPQLARFAIRDMGRTVAAGMCIKVTKKKEIQIK